MGDRCTFAHRGTYGHECGSPAEYVGVRASNITKSGIYFARRCAKCMTHHGGENTGISRWEKFDPNRHINEF